MGREQTLQLDLELPEGRPGRSRPAEEEPVTRSEEPPPVRRSRGKAEPRAPWRERMRRVLVWGAGAAAVAGGIALVYQADYYLASDAHFVLSAANLRIEGVRYASRDAVLRVFAEDIGRSIYLMPPAARRRALLTIDWVRDARVSRRWPNRVHVRIIERMPVAFVLVPGEPQALVDADGVMLAWPARARLALPVLRGITREQPPAARQERVRQVLGFLQDVQVYAGQISEIDAADPDNLNVVQTAEGRLVRLLMGNRNYLPRMKNFLSHYPEISRRLPAARIFDLRLDDRITVRPEIGEEPHGR